GVRIVKAFQAEELQRRRMRQGVEAVERMGNKIVLVQARMNALIEILAGVAISLVVLYAGWRNLSFGETPGPFFAFIPALLLPADPLRRLSRMQLQLAAASAGARMMYELLDTPAAEAEATGRALHMRDGEVRFKGVSFAYTPGAPVLTDLDL